MASVAFSEHAKTLTLSTTHKYNYIFIPPTTSSKSTILFLHGFPSSSYDWRHQISFFTANGYGVVVPDLLGYGGTSKPSSAEEYKAKRMAAEIIEILNHEKLDRLHAVSHDMGSILLSRLVNYYPGRFLSATFLAVPYSRPGEHFDLDAVNKMTRNVFGKEKFGYLSFFVSDYAGDMLDQYSDSFFSLFYPKNPDIWTDHVGPPGAMEAWLRADRCGEPAPYITDEERATHQEIMVGSHASALNWYRVLVWNLNEEDEIESGLSARMSCPVQMVLPPTLASQFAVGPSGSSDITNDLTIKSVSIAGHWVQLEARDEINQMLWELFERVDGGGSSAVVSTTTE